MKSIHQLHGDRLGWNGYVFTMNMADGLAGKLPHAHSQVLRTGHSPGPALWWSVGGIMNCPYNCGEQTGPWLNFASGHRCLR